ncbi:hypothetical protein PR202_gb11534 [Eleusine coracana subsp. coracana]|uniref:Sodium/calcium exchanger membrane region domain-containing protein n=1 Tax=Eleusine coracana subsp. coracana TaxID=191504 RepID=A0AAV5EMR7_ELECO|nr:hypothetical protein PR202_gb11534 [Eleusine coracana subsp. coracana]
MALPRGRASRSAAAPFPSACFLLFLLLTASSSLLSGPTSDADDEPPFSILRRGASASSSSGKEEQEQVGSCEALQSIAGGEARCRYLRSHARCSPSGYIDYLRLFYCGFAGFPAAVGLAALALWLAVLFYLLGDTASEYFCASLEGLSAALRLPPAVAGVTLLSLGNGAPDVFATVVSFAPSPSTAGGSGAVGLSSALGGALFVSTVVAGTVALSVAGRRGGGGGVVVEWRGFVRDLCVPPPRPLLPPRRRAPQRRRHRLGRRLLRLHLRCLRGRRMDIPLLRRGTQQATLRPAPPPPRRRRTHPAVPLQDDHHNSR